jgi:predicted PurR-regulated permease PerM
MIIHLSRNIIFFAVFAIFIAIIIAAKSILLPFVISFLLAYLLDPSCDKLEVKVKSRNMAAFILTFAVFGFLVLMLLYIMPILARQLQEFVPLVPDLLQSLQDKITPTLEKLQTYTEGYINNVDSLQSGYSDISHKLLGFVQNAFSSSLYIVNLLLLILLSPIITFYVLRDWDKMMAKIKDLLPDDYKDSVGGYFTSLNLSMAKLIRGQLKVSFALTIFYTLGLLVVGIPYGLLIGLVSGSLSIIPYVGFITGFVSSILVALYTYGGVDIHLYAVLAVFAIGQLLEGYVFIPRYIGKELEMHPVLIIFVLMAFGAILGFLGVLIALPLSVAIKTLLLHLYSKKEIEVNL